MGKVIAVASGKGGTGKTTTVAAVSSCLAALGKRTLCVDFDAGLKNLDLSLCMADYAVADYMDVIGGQMKITEACHEHPLIDGLFFLSAPAACEHGASDEVSARSMFSDIKDEFDFCIVDSPSGIGEGFVLAHAAADMSIIVTNGELPSMRDAGLAVDAARKLGVSELRLIVNRVIPGSYKRLRTTIDDVIDSVGARLIGVIREDSSVAMSLHENTPLVLYSKRRSAYDFLDVARRITGEDLPLKRV